MQFVIPGLTRNPVSCWISAFAGRMNLVVNYDAVYSMRLPVSTVFFFLKSLYKSIGIFFAEDSEDDDLPRLNFIENSKFINP